MNVLANISLSIGAIVISFLKADAAGSQPRQAVAFAGPS